MAFVYLSSGGYRGIIKALREKMLPAAYNHQNDENTFLFDCRSVISFGCYSLPAGYLYSTRGLVAEWSDTGGIGAPEPGTGLPQKLGTPG